MTKPIFTASVESRLIAQEMAKMNVGDIITHEQISEIMGVPMKDKPGPVYTAMKRLLRDENKAFGCVRGVGYKRLNDVEILAEGESTAASIRRRAKRSVERHMLVDFDKLNASQKTRFSAQSAVLGAIAMMARSTSIQKIQGKIADAGKRELPTAETLRMFLPESK